MCCTYRVKNSVEDPVSEDQGDDAKYEGEGGEEEEKEFLGGDASFRIYCSCRVGTI